MTNRSQTAAARQVIVDGPDQCENVLMATGAGRTPTIFLGLVFMVGWCFWLDMFRDGHTTLARDVIFMGGCLFLARVLALRFQIRVFLTNRRLTGHQLRWRYGGIWPVLEPFDYPLAGIINVQCDENPLMEVFRLRLELDGHGGPTLLKGIRAGDQLSDALLACRRGETETVGEEFWSKQESAVAGDISAIISGIAFLAAIPPFLVAAWDTGVNRGLLVWIDLAVMFVFAYAAGRIFERQSRELAMSIVNRRKAVYERILKNPDRL